MKFITITSYNIHKGMSPTNRLVRLMGMKDALLKANPDILCLQEVQGQNLKRTIDFAEFPDSGQHEWFGEFFWALHQAMAKMLNTKHGHHGNAVLSRHPLDPKHNLNITVNRLEKKRCVFIVRCIQMAGGVLWLCCVAI